MILKSAIHIFYPALNFQHLIQDIEKYLIYTSTQMNFNPTKEDSTGETTDTTFTVTGLTNGENYYFKVAAQDKDG